MKQILVDIEFVVEGVTYTAMLYVYRKSKIDARKRLAELGIIPDSVKLI
jgi:hypothetical protein